MINLTGAEKSPTIAEFYVNTDHVRMVLEIGQRDRDTITVEEFVIEADGQKLTPNIQLSEIRPRKPRLSRLPKPPVGPVSKEVQYLEVLYPFKGQPNQITFIPPLENGFTKSTIGFVTFHEALPIHDFRFLGQPATLNLNWEDPWYSWYKSVNLKRHHKDPVFAFLYVEPYETRFETLVRLRDLEPWMEQELSDEISIEEQQALLAEAAIIVAKNTPLMVDGVAVTPFVESTTFLELGLAGVTARTSAVVETRNSAIAGITLTYLTDRLPQEVSIEWRLFSDNITIIPAQAIDMAGPLRYLLSREDTKMTWNNFLKNYSEPTFDDIEVGTEFSFFSFFTDSAKPGDSRGKEIVSLALKNIYRAFDFNKEEIIYDKLAQTVTGDALTEIYLQNKKTMFLEETGGAKARVKDVTITEVKNVTSLPDRDGFQAQVVWSISGTVTHWGHSHNRQNNYEATISFIPVDGKWKVLGIKLQEKLRES